MPLQTAKQVGSSCILISSCIILSELTTLTIEDVAKEFLCYANNFIEEHDLDKGIIDYSDPFEAYNSFCSKTNHIKEFNNEISKTVFDPLCKKYNINSELKYFKNDSQEIESALKTGNSYISLSFEHMFTIGQNKSWHITPVGFEKGKFYTSDTNNEEIIIIGDSISDLIKKLSNTYGTIYDIGDGVLYSKQSLT